MLHRQRTAHVPRHTYRLHGPAARGTASAPSPTSIDSSPPDDAPSGCLPMLWVPKHGAALGTALADSRAWVLGWEDSKDKTGGSDAAVALSRQWVSVTRRARTASRPPSFSMVAQKTSSGTLLRGGRAAGDAPAHCACGGSGQGAVRVRMGGSIGCSAVWVLRWLEGGCVSLLRA